MGRCCIGILMNLSAIIFLSIGALFVAITQLNSESQSQSECIFKGYPPLPMWILGTGVSFLIIGVSCVAVFVLFTFVFPSIIEEDSDGFTKNVHWSMYVYASVIVGFLFAWMIVGSVSLWKDGANCSNPNSQIWNTGMAGVIVLTVFFGFRIRRGFF